MRKTYGFTLLELLVVIAIIGTLATLIVPNFMTIRERARDANRKSDLRQIQKALELYKSDQVPVVYPPDNTFLSVPGSSWTSATGTVYMSKIPGEPSKKPLTYYYYKIDDTDTLKYTLCACLENSAEVDSTAGDCELTNYTCASGSKYVINEP